ncbi:MAG TPA: TlpA disulfide reductase family protein [Terriglobales bacterium]|nr:TlpA disulfide reductase family protein [Terriglobales bacterium]
MSGAVLTALLACALAGCSGRVRPGRPVPDFSLVTADGRPVTLASFRGQVLVLDFWASWCPPCVEEAPALNALAQQLAGRPVRILAVSIDTDPAAYRRFLQQYHIRFATARDPSAALMHRYGTVQIPETYIIDQQGRLARKIVGAMDWSAPGMVAYLKDLAAGRINGPLTALR